MEGLIAKPLRRVLWGKQETEWRSLTRRAEHCGTMANRNQSQENLIQLFHSGTKIDEEGKLITSGGRVLSIVAQGESFNEAFSIAYKAIEKIDFSGINYRQDIGYQVRTQNK